MRFRPDDNAREAIRFLFLGTGIILGIQLIYRALAYWVFAPTMYDALTLAILPFQNDHLIQGGRTMVVGGTDLVGRVALALLVGLAGSILLGGAAAILAAKKGRSVLRPALFAGRTGLILITVWCIYAVLFLPPHSVVVQEDSLLVVDRPALFGEIAVPWLPHERTVPFERIERVRERTVSSSYDGCGTHEQVLALAEEEQFVIARIIPEGPDCDATVDAARTSATQLVIQLQAVMDRHQDKLGP